LHDLRKVWPSNPFGTRMKVAYFINQYPKVSHTFVRREIKALERIDVAVARYSLRSNSNDLVDQEDVNEASLTSYILDQGLLQILWTFLVAGVTRPMRSLRVFFLAFIVGWRSERGMLRNFAYVLEGAQLAKWCSRDQVQHIHAHFGTNSATVAMFASEFCDLPFSFTAHGADELDIARTRDMQEKLRRASFIVAASWYVRSQLMRKIEFPVWNKIKVVHCGLDGDFLECDTPQFPKSPQILCVGRLCDEKAQLLLVLAVAQLKKRRIDFRLVLAGDGPNRAQIERAVAEAGLQENVTITGWVSGERVRQEIASATLFVLPSLIEGLPVAIMEAMALGRPVISTFIAGIPELVISGETGWLVPAGDVEALAGELANALSLSEIQLRKIGEAGKKRVRDRHDVMKEALKLKTLFQALP
jgi:colanic acid/amylovoran biosynthesis glycosyltransferase